MTILNTKNIDALTNPLFCGQSLGLCRTDVIKYPQIKDLYKKQCEMFWQPYEISLQKDRADYDTLEEHEKFMFTSNLLYQTMMDSVISRGAGGFIQHVTNCELEQAMRAWEFFETIHADSYSYIIQNVYANPKEVFDRALEDKEILKRAIHAKHTYEFLMNGDYNDLKGKIYLGLVSANILEAIRFYVSFVCSFAFGENKKMNGNAEIIKLIRRDEAYHYRLSQTVLNILQTHDDEGFIEVVKKYKETVYNMFLDAAKEEKDWCSYIFSKGSIRGLNEKILGDYIEWLVDTRLEAINMPKYFGTKNPIGGWLEPWMNSSSIQVAPQEHEITSYRIAASKHDLSNMDFDDIIP